MGVEIERKFLVTDVNKATPFNNEVMMMQGYLQTTPTTVRVRIADENAYLTIKGLTNNYSRAEFEYDIPLPDAREMLRLCEGPMVEKRRFRNSHRGHIWEIDIFMGDNAGLIVAEIELTSEEDEFEIPPWVGKEVSNDPRYFNSALLDHPYKDWNDED